MKTDIARAPYPWTRLLGLALIWFQIGMIVKARFDPLRYFCWAPFDSRNHYQVTMAEINGQSLDEAEFAARYRVPFAGLEWRAIAHLKDLIEQYERTYGRGDSSRLAIEYRTNGGPRRTWTFAKQGESP